jgi:hypothetical protein
MNLQLFIDKYNGKFVDYDGKFGYQCVDLMRFYINEIFGLNPYDILPGAIYAKQIFQRFPATPSASKYFTKIINTPTGVPKKGDIVFWGWYPFVTGIAGHVAIFVEGDTNRFISFDQNFPLRSSCHYVNHSYRGVMGWLTLRR